MNSDRNSARIAGALFITAAVAGILSLPFVAPTGDPEYLTKAAENGNQVVAGALLQVIMAGACAGIAIWLYPVLRRHDEALALGSVGFRIIEAVLLVVSALSVLSLLTLSQEYVRAGAPEVSYFPTLGTLLLAMRDWTGLLLSQIAFGLGALMYYRIFYQSRLIPRWLSGWGAAAIVLHLSAALLEMIGGVPLPPATILLHLPILVNELVLAVWLIAKGFDSAAVASGPVRLMVTT